MISRDFQSRPAKVALSSYLLIWGASTFYLGMKGADWVFPIVSLLLFGGIVSALGWWLTRQAEPKVVAVHRPGLQTAVFAGYVVLYAFALVGLGLGAVKGSLPPGQVQEIAVLAYKLAIHVAVPAALVLALGGKLKDTARAGLRQRGVILSLIALSALFFALLTLVSPSLRNMSGVGLTFPSALFWVALAWVWMSLEAGLCEEYLFRAVLQSRLSAWLASPIVAIAITSVTFALVHWPGLYLRGGPGVDGWSTDPGQVAAFTIATLSPLSIMLGVLWSRTHSLLLVAVVHGAIDALPHTAEFAQIWSGFNGG
jgi:membrane protease YdiL (CAAX protease family)